MPGPGTQISSECQVLEDLALRATTSLFNYRHFLGRYIIYESKLKKYGKEYNGYDDGLIYEGEYLNEKKNGKGKEFDRYYKKKI